MLLRDGHVIAWLPLLEDAEDHGLLADDALRVALLGHALPPAAALATEGLSDQHRGLASRAVSNPC